MGSVKLLQLLLVPIMLAGCGSMIEDLNPSGSDERPLVQGDSTGPAVGQQAPDFMLSDSLGNEVTLSTSFTATGVQGVVLYFTMWCPICDGHMSHIQSAVIPNSPNVRFFAVDYVSGSTAGARQRELENGYAGSGFTVLADTQQDVLDLYQATMGSTVVIDNAGVVRMNEDYKDGQRLQAVLAGLP